MNNIDIMLDELLNKLGKTKEDLVMSLNNLQQYVESQEHGDLKYISLQRMFFLREEFQKKLLGNLNWKMTVILMRILSWIM